MLLEDAKQRKDNNDLAKSILYQFRNFIMSNLTHEENDLLYSYYNPTFKTHICRNLENKLEHTGTSLDYKVHVPKGYDNLTISISTKLQAHIHGVVSEYKNNMIHINILPIDRMGEPHIVVESVYFLTQYNKFKEKFIHEVIHWLDDNKSKGYVSSHPTSELSYKEYYNTSSEVNAHLQEMLEYIGIRTGEPKYRGLTVNEKVREIMLSKDFLEEYEEFLNNLNKDNRKKVLKRIYDYFREYKKLFENNCFVCKIRINPLPRDLIIE